MAPASSKDGPPRDFLRGISACASGGRLRSPGPLRRRGTPIGIFAEIAIERFRRGLPLAQIYGHDARLSGFPPVGSQGFMRPGAGRRLGDEANVGERGRAGGLPLDGFLRAAEDG